MGNPGQLAPKSSLLPPLILALEELLTVTQADLTQLLEQLLQTSSTPLLFHLFRTSAPSPAGLLEGDSHVPAQEDGLLADIWSS